MKTYYFNRKRLSTYALFGFLAIVTSSCGSYQNSSYYDNDGAYGGSQTNNNNSQSNKYQEYFSDLNKDAEAFTGIDSYTSVTNDSIKKTENYNSNNAGWGNNPQSVTVNVYDNNWGYDIIDGTHRANALRKLGIKSIISFVGLNEHQKQVD